VYHNSQHSSLIRIMSVLIGKQYSPHHQLFIPPFHPMKISFRLLPVVGLALTLLATSCSKKEYAFFSAGSRGATAQLKVQQTPQALAEAPVQSTTTTATPVATVESFAPVAEVTTPATAPALASNANVAKAVAEVKQMSLVQKVKLAKEMRQTIKNIKEGKDATAAQGGKSQLIALLLVIFLGGFSIHRFYLGYTTEGILQILTVLLCGLGFIWVIIDLIRILTGDLKPKGGEYAETL